MILFLESVLTVNSDYTCRLMLCRAYGIIGAIDRVQKLLQSLDIKFVQRDTLGEFYTFVYKFKIRAIKKFSNCFRLADIIPL